MMLLDLLHTGAGVLMLAAAGGGVSPFKCTVPQAPKVIITPRSADIKYDFSRTMQQLTAVSRRYDDPKDKTSRRDAMTGGLRHGNVEVNTEIIWSYREETVNKVPTRACVWYSTINIEIYLNPVIYVARENSFPGPCREAVLTHERRHVQVDRLVMNRFAQDLGVALQRAVQETGAIGPFPAVNRVSMGKELEARVARLIEKHQRAMEATMDAKQAEVDSAAEYERITRICQADRARQRTR